MFKKKKPARLPNIIKKQGNLKILEGEGSVDDIFDRLSATIDKKMK